MPPTVSKLLEVLESLGLSSQFCASGSLTPVLPGLEVDGVGKVGVPVSAADAQRLIAQAAQAPYGRGDATIVDTKVRQVWQLEPRQFALPACARSSASPKKSSTSCTSSWFTSQGVFSRRTVTRRRYRICSPRWW